MKDKWVCKKCGNELNEQPHKNQICNKNGCKGRFIKFTKCKCGEWFVNPKRKKYCSDKCAGVTHRADRKGKQILICDCCGNPFERYTGNIKNEKHHFCNKACKIKYNKGETVVRECKHCGKTFSVYKSAIEKSNASGNFCSTQCYWDSMKKDKLFYKGFKDAKRKYFSKPQVCAICGKSGKIQIHHIIPNRLTQDQRKQNLIPLCPLHHIRIERMTADLHESFKDDYETELILLNTILRARQAVTYTVLKELASGKH